MQPPASQPPLGVRTITVKGQRLRIAIRPGDPGPSNPDVGRGRDEGGARLPLLLMNGIGANLELLQPFVDALAPAIEVIRFTVLNSQFRRSPC